MGGSVSCFHKVRFGLLLRWESLWIGAHYSPYNRRWCINLVPFVTIWIALRGGRTPQESQSCASPYS